VTGKDFVAAGEQGSKEKSKAKKAAAAGGGPPAEPAKNKKAERIAARLVAEQAGKGAATKDVSACALIYTPCFCLLQCLLAVTADLL
jgi:hypothetical protein